MQKFRLTLLAVSIVGLSACAGTPPSIAPAPVIIASNKPVIDAEKTRLMAELNEARVAQARLSERVNALEALPPPAPVVIAAPTPPPANDGYPPNAKAGECYARVVNPPVFKTVTEKKVLKASSERIEIIPAVSKMVEEKVLVKPAGKKIAEIIPAVYRLVEDKVLVKPASERLVEVPATYKVVEEKELVKPASTQWKKGTGAIQKIDGQTGEIMCLVDIPAEYRTVKKTVVATPAEVKRIPIPAEYNLVKRQELVEAAQVREVETPAEYKIVQVAKVVSPAEEKRIPLPATYQEITREELVKEGSQEWQPILCETNTTTGVVEELQRALVAKGFNPGKIDGDYGAETHAAVNAYQKANGLATGGLTLETLKRLGVSVNKS